MDRLIPSLYKEYGMEANERMLPFIHDGLRPSERRILISAYEKARDRMKKSRTIDSYVTGTYHAHGSCLYPDTLIPLLDGTEETIENLSYRTEPFWVYSSTKDGKVVPGLAHSARVTNTISTLYELELDNGQTLVCTGDHLIMLRSGLYTHAEELEEGTSLMPLYLRMEDGYTYCRENKEEFESQKKVSWLVIEESLGEDIYNYLKNGYEVHHIDGNRSNDNPENIELITKEEHRSITAKNLSDEVRVKIGQKIKEKFRNDQDRRNKLLNGLKKGREKMFDENSPIRDRIRNKNSKLISSYNKIQGKDKAIKVAKVLVNEGREINKENYEEARKRFYNYPKYENLGKYFNSIEELSQIANNNHTVTKIRKIKLDNPINVYDMSVEKYHNFAVSAGIFVHNCYGTIIQLVRNKELLLKQGNFGSDIGIEPKPASADRYTETMISEFAIHLCLKLQKFVPHKTADVDDTYREPTYLPTMFPVCFIGNKATEGIAFGYKTEIPPYKIKDLHERLLWLLGQRKEEPIIEPVTDSQITSDKNEIRNLLTTGKVKINYKGIYDLEKQNKKVHIRSFPPNKRFPALWKKFEKEANNGDIGYQDMSSQKTGGTNVEIEVLKNRNSSKIFDSLVEKLDRELRSSESFEVIVVDENGKPKNMSVDDLLLHCYNIYVQHSTDMLKEKVESINSTIQEYEDLKSLRPVLSEYISENDISDYKKAVKELSSKSNLPEENVKYLIQKYRINKLLTLDLDTTKMEEERDKYNKYLKNPSKYVLKDYNQMIKEFG